MYSRSDIEKLFENYSPNSKEKGVKLVVVYNKKTNKIVPFKFMPNGEVMIVSTKETNLDDLHVDTFYTWELDFENGLIIDYTAEIE